MESMPIIPYRDHFPKVHESVFVAPTAWITGKVSIGENSSVFFGASLRGDVQRIIIGSETNVQDNAVIHSSRGKRDCIIGDQVTIGHCAILHGCTVHSRCIIGMGATVLDDAEIGEECIVGANALVTMNTIIPPRSLVIGAPAKVVRQLTSAELTELCDSAASYRQVSAVYRDQFRHVNERG